MQPDLFSGQPAQVAFPQAARLSKALAVCECAAPTRYGVTHLIKATRLQELPCVPMEEPAKVLEYWHQHVATLPHFEAEKEHLVVFGLNAKWKLCGVSIVGVGTQNECLAHPREIFRPVVAMNAFAFILAHNHPSGDPTPSSADTQLTRKIVECGHLMQVRLMDHVVIGQPGQGENGKGYWSFREGGVV